MHLKQFKYVNQNHLAIRHAGHQKQNFKKYVQFQAHYT